MKSRKFVRERLRFVDMVHKPFAPIVGGVATALVIGAMVWLPLVAPVTAVLAGVGIGAGISHGSRDSKRLPAP
jgi:ABC-type enterobactin transport system permease subunit